MEWLHKAGDTVQWRDGDKVLTGVVCKLEAIERHDGTTSQCYHITDKFDSSNRAQRLVNESAICGVLK